MTGKRLKALRQSRKWTQTKMADKLGVHYRTIGKWESEQQQMSRKYRNRICYIFNLELETEIRIQREDRFEQRKRNKEILKQLNKKYPEMRDWDLDDPLVMKYQKGVGAK